MFSGTTCVVVWVWNNVVICANAGDSRAVLFSQGSSGAWSFQPLNRDHKPDEPDEAARIKK